MTQIVFAHEGTVVKIPGDSVSAIFGAPIQQPDHARRAVQGDSINIAARLESANRQLGTRLCASASAAEEIPDFRGRPVGDRVLKGRKEAILVHEPLTEERFVAPQTKACIVAYETLVAGDAAGARQAFAAYVGKYGDDPLALFRLQRLLAGENTARGAAAKMTGVDGGRTTDDSGCRPEAGPAVYVLRPNSFISP